MVLTRLQISAIEEKTGKILLTKNLSEEVKKITVTIYTELSKITEKPNENLLSRTLLNAIALSLERLEEEIQEKIGKEVSTKEIANENIQLTKQIESLQAAYNNQKEITDNLVEESDKNEKEYKRINEENTSIIKTLRMKLDKKEKEVDEIQKTKEEIQKINRELKDENHNIKVILDKKLNEEEAAKKKTKNNSPGQQIPNNLLEEFQAATASTSNAEQPPAQPVTLAADSNQTSAANGKVPITRLFIIGDSHTRDLSSIFQNVISPKFSSKTICMPGKTIGYVVNTIKPEKLTPNSLVCIVAGANDVFQTKWNDIQDSLDRLYRKCKNNEILIVLSPPRYNIRKMNKHIINLNVKIKHYIKKYNNMSCLDPHNFINLQHMSSDLTHMNQRGKFLLCSKIVHRVFGIPMKSHNSMITNKNTSPNSMQYNRYNNNYSTKHVSKSFTATGNIGNQQFNRFHDRNCHMHRIQGVPVHHDRGYDTKPVPPAEFNFTDTNNHSFPPLPTQRNVQYTHETPYTMMTPYSDILTRNPYDTNPQFNSQYYTYNTYPNVSNTVKSNSNGYNTHGRNFRSQMTSLY